MAALLVIGSANADHVMEFEQLPKPGQTLMSQGYRLELGGKGANQAIAVARLKQAHTQVSYIAALGQDAAADNMLATWSREQINLAHIFRFADANTGSAMIFLGNQGQNSIGVAPGANSLLTPAMLDEKQAQFEEADYLLIQLETPLDTVKHALELARNAKCTTILNPAPAASLNKDLLALVDIITPNETEAEALTGIKVTDTASAEQAATVLHELGINTVIITLGEQGAFLSQVEVNALAPELGTTNVFSGIIPAYPVTAIDTVAAGDTFNGALMVALNEGMAITHAIDFANKASSIAVTRHGAQRGIPSRAEL